MVFNDNLCNRSIMAEVARQREPAPRRPVLTTKLSPPRIRRSRIVRRNALLAKFDRALDGRAILIVAPAGYGKTTALGEWCSQLSERGLPYAWLTIDDSDNDPVQFVGHLIDAISQNVPALSGKLRGVLDYGIDLDPSATAAALLNLLHEFDREIVLILDDLHVVENRRITEFLELLLSGASPNVHLVMSSRSRPDLKLGKLRALGEVAELSSRDFQFTVDDARSFFAQNAPIDLSDSDLDQMVERTEGWAAGLKLAALAMVDGEPATLPSLVSGAHRGIGDFLRDEVLSRLPAAMVDFVIDIATLGQFNAELCGFVTERPDAGVLLAELEARQLFVHTLAEPGWYRFHQLFSDVLSEMLHQRAPMRAGELHEKAASWYSRLGLTAAALQHIFASGNLPEAARILDECAEALLQSGQGATLLRYAASLPPELLADHPNLQLERVYASTLTWAFADARRTLGDLRKGLMNSARAARWEAAGVDLAHIGRKLIHREMQLAILSDDMPAAASFARQWLTMDGACSPFEDAVTQTSLIYAEREGFDCRGAGAAGRAREIFVEHGKRWGTVWHDCIIGATHALTGDLGRARIIYEGALRTAEDVVGRRSPTAAMPALHLAELLYETNELDTARAAIDEFLPLATRTGLVDQLVAAYQTKSRLAALESSDAALLVLDEGEEIAQARGFDRLHAYLVADRIRILAGGGEVSEARRVASVNNLAGPLDAFAPRKGLTTRAAAAAFGAAQLAIIDNNLVGAEGLLRRWLRFLDDHRCVRFAIRFAMVLAHAQILSGDAKASHRTIRSALQVGLRGRFVRSFADANPAVRAQIEQMKLANAGVDAPLAAYHAEIVAVISGQAPSAAPAADALGGQFDALNDREAEILLMVATGMMNSHIAEEVGLTLGTVKWYLQQIYTKLGVNRRSEAVFKARQLGLIA